MDGPEKYHKKRRKGVRSHFYRYRKNKENVPPDFSHAVALATSPVTDHPFSPSQSTNTPDTSTAQPFSTDQPACIPSTSEAHPLPAECFSTLPSGGGYLSPLAPAAILPTTLRGTTATLPTALRDTTATALRDTTATLPTALRDTSDSNPTATDTSCPVQPAAIPLDTHGIYPVHTPNTLPKHWQLFHNSSESDTLQYCKVQQDGVNHLYKVIASVVVDVINSSWEVYSHGKKVPLTCNVLSKFPQGVVSSSFLVEIMCAIDQSLYCPGNPDPKFVQLCRYKGGEVKGQRGNGPVVAVLEDNPVTDTTGEVYSQTIRRVDCEILCRGSEPDVSTTQRCDRCKSLRSTLRSAVCRQKSSCPLEKTSASSHTKYSALTTDETRIRMKNLHNSVRTANEHIHKLEEKIAALIDDESVPLLAEDQADLTSVMDSVRPLVEKQYPMSSPQRIFWEQQAAFNKLNDKRQMRWHPLVLRFALNLKYMSTSAYKAVRQSGIIRLPSERTLADYTHWSSPHAGVQLEYIERYSTMLEDVPCGQRHTALLMDEMKIKKGLVFNKHTGTLVGFVDLGSVNQDIDAIYQDKPTESNAGKLADQVFVFMVRAVFKPSLTMPVAHFFSLNLKGEQIFPLVWEVVEAVELYDIPITSLTSDGAKPNRRFYRMCNKNKRELPYKTHNPYRLNESLYFFCDVPHLLKTARNCFSNSYAHSKSRTLQRNGQAISWKWIEHLFLKETTTNTPGVRIAYKLTKDHVWLTSFTRMRVYLAAQVMSESVACALQSLNEEGTRETRLFIRMIDRFFDYLNVKSPILWELKRKDSIAPYVSKFDERFKWLKEDFINYLDEWKREAVALPLSIKEKQRCCLSRETQEGIKITVSSFTELGPLLLQLPNVKYLLSEVFSQDPLERYFSRQRHRGGSNENPTAFQVPYNASTLVQQQSMYRDIKTMNVEPESSGVEVMSTPLPKRRRK